MPRLRQSFSSESYSCAMPPESAQPSRYSSRVRLTARARPPMRWMRLPATPARQGITGTVMLPVAGSATRGCGSRRRGRGCRSAAPARAARRPRPCPCPGARACEQYCAATAEVVHGGDHGPVFPRKLLRHRKDPVLVADIEAGAGLVQKHHVRVLHQRLGKEHELALAAGKLAEAPVLQPEQPDVGKHAARPVAVVGGLRLEPPQVRVAAHEEHFHHGERKGLRGLLAHEGDLRARGRASREAMSRPSRLTSPADGRSRPARRRRSVVLPAPFGPMIPTSSPRLTARSTPVTIGTAPARQLTPLAWRRAAAHRGLRAPRRWMRTIRLSRYGLPRIAVMMPTRISKGGTMDLPKRSQSTRKSAPPSAEAGMSVRCPGPTMNRKQMRNQQSHESRRARHGDGHARDDGGQGEQDALRPLHVHAQGEGPFLPEGEQVELPGKKRQRDHSRAPGRARRTAYAASLARPGRPSSRR